MGLWLKAQYCDFSSTGTAEVSLAKHTYQSFLLKLTWIGNNERKITNPLPEYSSSCVKRWWGNVSTQIAAMVTEVLGNVHFVKTGWQFVRKVQTDPQTHHYADTCITCVGSESWFNVTRGNQFKTQRASFLFLKGNTGSPRKYRLGSSKSSNVSGGLFHAKQWMKDSDRLSVAAWENMNTKGEKWKKMWHYQ